MRLPAGHRQGAGGGALGNATVFLSAVDDTTVNLGAPGYRYKDMRYGGGGNASFTRFCHPNNDPAPGEGGAVIITSAW